MLRFFVAFLSVVVCGAVNAEQIRYEDIADSFVPAVVEDTEGLITIDDVINRPADSNTDCSAKVFADAVAQNAKVIDPETAFDIEVQQMVEQTFVQQDVLERIVNCPEIQNADEMDTVKFKPVYYTFENGREIVINYETQPKVLKDRLRLLQRPDLPRTDEASPKIDGNAFWTNVDPAWYGIIVVEAGSLDEFVGEGKNNTISLEYIKNHINDLYPKDYGNGDACTSRSAWADDDDSVNQAVVTTVGRGDDDSNDYYVAGDIDLGWVMYAEIAADIALTVATMGTGTMISGAAKSARAARAIDKTTDAMRALEGTDKVGAYLRIVDEMDAADDMLDVYKTQRASKADDAARYAQNWDNLTDAQRKDITDIQNNITRYEDEYRRLVDRNAGSREIQKARSKLRSEQQKLRTKRNKYGIGSDDAQRSVDSLDDAIRKTEQRIDTLRKRMRMFEKNDDVKKYKKLTASLEDLKKYRQELKGLTDKRGNVFARSWRGVKAWRAANSGGKVLRRAERLVRASSFSGRVRDPLFVSSRQFASMLGQGIKNVGMGYALLNFAGDMYDQTSDSTDEHTNGIDFTPLLLLSADDIPGQENVVNYGMWMMWIGDAGVPADDDAAYLQAFDFATKFHNDLMTQQDGANSPCNVDIYVVRPIIRNPASKNAQMFYLIMNDVPFSTGN